MTDFRVIFSKKGSLAFISHLDLTHSIIRALKRAGLPLKYSEGFNPRPKLAFGLPLSVGAEGENEILDFSLTEDISPEEVKERLQNAITGELIIKSIGEQGKKLKYIRYAKYIVEFPEFKGDISKVSEVLSNPPAIMKRTKSGDKLTDIKLMMKEAHAKDEGGSLILNLTLTAYDSMNLNPEYVVTSLGNAGLELPEDYKITRTEIIFED